MGYTKGEVNEDSFIPSKTDGGKRILETVESVLKLPVLAIPEYGITLEGAEYFEVRSALSTSDGITIEKSYFPYYNQKGKISGFKVRDWKIPKKQKYHITVVGDVGIHCKLFGQQQAESVKRQKKSLIFLEGEGSVIAGWQGIKESTKGTPYADLDPHVVGLSCGTSNAVASVTANEQFIREFTKTDDSKITLGYDNDQATTQELEKGIKKGWDAIEDVAGFLMTANIYTYDYGNYNDARDWWNDGDKVQLGKHLSFNMKKYHPEKIVSIDDLSFEQLTEKRVEGYPISAFPELNKKIHGFRKKELVLVTAPSGAGKSTVVTEISHELSYTHGQKLGLIYLEEVVQETSLRLIAKYLKVNFNGPFKFNPLSVVSEDRFREGMEAIKGKAVLVDHFGSMAVDILIRKIKYMEHVNNCDFIILDHLSMVFSATATTNERKLIDELMTALSSYVSNSNIGIIAVSHITRKPFEWKLDKDKNKLPTWVEVSKESMRGAGSLEQMSWIIIGIEPEMLPDRSRGRVRLVVLKNRPWSYTGQCDTLKMNDETGEFYSCPDEPEDY